MISLNISVLFLITVLYNTHYSAFTLSIFDIILQPYPTRSSPAEPQLKPHPTRLSPTKPQPKPQPTNLSPGKDQRVINSDLLGNNKFAQKIYYSVAQQHKKNMVFSPSSVYTGLALIYLGAEGSTAKEIGNALYVNQYDKNEFASKYGEILRATFNTNNAKGPQLSMATRLYVNDKIKIRESFNQDAQNNFECIAENINFGQPSTAVANINDWVEQQTENRIQNLLKSIDVDDATSAVLVNAIYFKAKWLQPFSTDDTKRKPFYKSNGKKILVEMMHQSGPFRYAKLNYFNAEAIELRYKNSDISMLIIMPFGDFNKLEQEIKNINLNKMMKQMTLANVNVQLPKFRIESPIDFIKPLKKMGFSEAFNPGADLTGMFESDEPQLISEIKQKAFFDCNEGGSEAAASSFVKIESRSGLMIPKRNFTADRPFVFIVRNENTVFFSGHVTMDSF